jgi:DNA invertase Pin-like site-specific DNA recombinase
MSTNVAVYFRCSTDKQDKSIQDQRQVLEKYAKDNDLTITAWFERDEGKSGTSFEKRPDFMRMVKLVESAKHDFSRILVYDIDRWGRPVDPDESNYWEFHFKRFGVQVEYISDTSVNDKSLAGRLSKKIKQELASEESHKQSLRVRERSKMRATEGFRVGGFAPYGFKRQLISSEGALGSTLEHGSKKSIKTDRVRLVPGDPAQIAIVKEIFESRSKGVSNASICKTLNARQVPPPSAHVLGIRRQLNPVWTVNSVYHILTNPVYRGTLVYNRQAKGSWVHVEQPGLRKRTIDQCVVKADAYEGLVDTELYDAVQKQLRTDLARRPRQFRSESVYLLSGLVACSCCGGKLHGHVHRMAKNKPSHYYYESGCSSVISGSAHTCRRIMIPKDKLENHVLGELSQRILPGVDLDRLQKRIEAELKHHLKMPADERKLVTKEMNAKQTEIDRLIDSIAKGIDPDLVNSKISKLRGEYLMLQSRLDSLDKSDRLSKDLGKLVKQVGEQVSDLRTVLQSGPLPLVKQVLPAMIQKIAVDSASRTADCYFYSVPRVEALEALEAENVGYTYAGGRGEVNPTADLIVLEFRF